MKRYIFIIPFILLFASSAWPLEIVCKIGDKYPPAHPTYLKGWRDGQIVELFPDGQLVPGGQMFMSFVVIRVNDTYVKGDLNLKKYMSAKDTAGKYDWELGSVERQKIYEPKPRKRDYFVDYKKLLNDGHITQSIYDDIYDKSKANPLVIINTTLNSLLLDENMDMRLAK